MNLTIIESVGGVAGLLTTIAFLSQALLVYKSKDTSSISLMTYSIFVSGLLFWIIFGSLSRQLTIIIPNGITFILAVYILTMKMREPGRNKSLPTTLNKGEMEKERI